MIYPYVCPKCDYYHEVVAHHTKIPKAVKCDECGADMDRKFTVPQVSIPQRGYYDPGLGAQINNKQDIKDAMQRIEDNTGTKIEEVGNEINIPHRRSSLDIWSEHIDELKAGGAFDKITDDGILDMQKDNTLPQGGDLSEGWS